MFAYCGNNPIAHKDEGGKFWHIVAGAVVGAAVSFATSVLSDVIAGEEIDWVGAGISAAFGAVGGALAATGIPPVWQIAGGALLSGVENAIEQGREKGFDKIDGGEVAINAIIGGVSASSNGVSKATSNHLHKQAQAATKRIVNSAKHDTAAGTIQTLKKTVTYYFSQTKTLYYKELADDAINELLYSAGSSLAKALTIPVY